MTKKVLFVGTMLRGHMLVFHLPYMKWFQEQGYEVHLCARNDTEGPVDRVPYCDRYIELPFERSPLSAGNGAVAKKLKRLIDEGDYTLIHCNTPVGGMLGRLCARGARKKGTKVVYTAHGFHFFTGAPLKNWLLFYPAERWLARYTDLLITINIEDEKRARRFPAKNVARVNGVGVDLSRFDAPVDRAAIRASLGIGETEPVLITVGEHSARKNQAVLLKAAAELPKAQVLLCGWGEKLGELQSLARELHMEERVHFLGFRKDVPALLKCADVFVFPSLQEGLPVAQMEAMAAGLPCVVSNVRGNADLIRPGEGGMLEKPDDVEGFRSDISALLQDPSLRQTMGARNAAFIKPYGLAPVLVQMAALYTQMLKDVD
ncbi:MAG: glycosyltransferase family 4 protein [Eubacteriales bacterium]|nr:glycosyltransferase family 4 protein [Eubacteriales bacterium]